jgi:D-alanyl-lipoteichoic acid acyltransferase DltB (MBOAT superfamily)
VLFNSYVFLFAFLPVVLAGYAWLRRHPERRWTIAWLVIASLVYYAWWKPEFLLR